MAVTCPHCNHPADSHDRHGCDVNDRWSSRCPCELSAEAVEEDARMAA